MARRARDGFRDFETYAAPAHPADLSRGNADDEGVGLHVVGDHCASADECVATELRPADNRRVCANRCALADMGREIFVLARDLAARIDDVCKYGARTDESVAFDPDSVIDRDIVLDTYSITDHGGRGNVDVLAKRTAGTDPRTGRDVTEMPDFGVVSNNRAVVDDGRVVLEPAHRASIARTYDAVAHAQ